MSEQQTKRRFFIAGDVVKHKKTGVVYTVDSHQDYEDAVDIFYEPSNVECLHKELWTQALVPFDELEMVEPYGVYMSNYIPTTVRADDNPIFKGLDDEIKQGYVGAGGFEILSTVTVESALSEIVDSLNAITSVLRDIVIKLNR